MTHSRSSRIPDVDRHADAAALPPELRAAWARQWRPDPIEEMCVACTPELGPDGWQHERSCPARRRTA